METVVMKQAHAVLDELLSSVATGLMVADGQAETHLKYAALGGQVMPLIDRLGINAGGVLALIELLKEDVFPPHKPADNNARLLKIDNNIDLLIVEEDLDVSRRVTALYSIVSPMAIEMALREADIAGIEFPSFKLLCGKLGDAIVDGMNAESPQTIVSRVGALCYLALAQQLRELQREDEKADETRDMLRLTQPADEDEKLRTIMMGTHHDMPVDDTTILHSTLMAAGDFGRTIGGPGSRVERHTGLLPLVRGETGPLATAPVVTSGINLEGVKTGRVSTAKPNTANRPKAKTKAKPRGRARVAASK